MSGFNPGGIKPNTSGGLTPGGINSSEGALIATMIFNDAAVDLPNVKTRCSIIVYSITLHMQANYHKQRKNPHHSTKKTHHKPSSVTLPLSSHHLPYHRSTSSALRRSCSCSSAAFRASSASRLASASSTKRCSRSASSASLGMEIQKGWEGLERQLGPTKGCLVSIQPRLDQRKWRVKILNKIAQVKMRIIFASGVHHLVMRIIFLHLWLPCSCSAMYTLQVTWHLQGCTRH